MSNVMDPKFQPPVQPTQVTPQQLAILLVMETVIQALQLGAHQLGTNLGMKEPAELLDSARVHIIRGVEKMQRDWDRRVVVVQPEQVAQLVKG